MKTLDAIVIGAGHNGLVAAAYLARAGLRVVVVERSEVAGGCAATEEVWPGYRVDTGAHGSSGIEARVMADLDLAGAGLRVAVPDPWSVVPQPGGEALLLEADAARTSRRIRRFSARDAARWPDFVAAMARARRVLAVLYRTLPPRLAGGGRGDALELVRLVVRLGRVGRREAVELMRLIPMSIEELLHEWFESRALRGALAAQGVWGIFQGPLASGTGYIFLHHGMGASSGGSGKGAGGPWRLTGGMGALGEVLRRVAAAAGAEIRLGCEVSAVRVEDGCATGIDLADGECLHAPLIVSGADPGHTLLELVGPGELAPEFVRALTNIKYRGALAKVHLALGEPPRLRTGDAAPQAAVLGGAAVTVAPSIEYVERAYDAAKYGRPSPEPIVEAVLTTALDPGLAPRGRHILSAVAQYAPFELADGSWDDAAREALGDAVVAALAPHVPNLEGAILHRQVLTPADLADRFALPEGNSHHGEMTLDQVFFGRPVGGWARYRTPIKGLYLCGAGTHPGGGLNGRPGAGAAARILRDVKAG